MAKKLQQQHGQKWLKCTNIKQTEIIQNRYRIIHRLFSHTDLLLNTFTLDYIYSTVHKRHLHDSV